jgi:hypothetical protein
LPRHLLSDDPFYVRCYPAEHLWWRECVSPETHAAARRIKRTLRDEDGGIVSASLVLYLSVTRSTTLAGALADLRHLGELQRCCERTPYWTESPRTASDTATAPGKRRKGTPHVHTGPSLELTVERRSPVSPPS